MTPDYRTDWEGGEAAPSPAAERWKWPKTWANTMRYERGGGCRLYVRRETSDWLRVVYASVRDVDAMAAERLRAVGEEFPADFAMRLGDAARAAMGAAGWAPGTLAYAALDRAVARAAQRALADWRLAAAGKTRAPYVATMRLAVSDWRLVEADGPRRRIAGGGLDVWVEAMREEKFPPEASAYCECALLGDGWWVRFVRVSAVEARQARNAGWPGGAPAI